MVLSLAFIVAFIAAAAGLLIGITIFDEVSDAINCPTGDDGGGGGPGLLNITSYDNLGTLGTDGDALYFEDDDPANFIVNSSGRINEAVFQDGMATGGEEAWITLGNDANKDQWDFLQKGSGLAAPTGNAIANVSSSGSRSAERVLLHTDVGDSTGGIEWETLSSPTNGRIGQVVDLDSESVIRVTLTEFGIASSGAFGNVTGVIWSNVTADGLTTMDGDEVEEDLSDEIIDLSSGFCLPQPTNGCHLIFNFTGGPTLTGTHVVGFKWDALNTTEAFGPSIKMEGTYTESGSFCAYTNSTSGFWDACGTYQPFQDADDDLMMEIVVDDTVSDLSASTTVAPTKLIGYWTFDDAHIDDSVVINAGTFGSAIDGHNFLQLIGEERLPGGSAKSGESIELENSDGGDDSWVSFGTMLNRQQWDFLHDNSTVTYSIAFSFEMTGGAVSDIMQILSTQWEDDPTFNHFALRFGDSCDQDGTIVLDISNNDEPVFDEHCFNTIPIPDEELHHIFLTVNKTSLPNPGVTDDIITARLCIDNSLNCETFSETGNDIVDNDPVGTPSQIPLTLIHSFPISTYEQTEVTVDDLAIWKDYLLTDSDIDAISGTGTGGNVTELVSINFWINGDVDGSPQYPLLSTWLNDAAWSSDAFSFDTSDDPSTLLYIVEDGIGVVEMGWDDFPADDGQWHMVTVVMDKALAGTSGFANYYIDGQLKTLGFFNPTSGFSGTGGTPDSPLLIGGIKGNQLQAVTENGYNVDDVAIWHGYKLTPSDISTLYNSGVGSAASSISSSNLKGYYSFDNSTANGVSGGGGSGGTGTGTLQCEQAKDTAWTVIGILPVALFFAVFAIFSMFGRR